MDAFMEKIQEDLYTYYEHSFACLPTDVQIRVWEQTFSRLDLVLEAKVFMIVPEKVERQYRRGLITFVELVYSCESILQAYMREVSQ